MMPTCDEQCGNFADCAVSECDGYDDDARQALVDGCMEICEPTPAIAGVYAMYETCEEKIEFASGAREGFSALCAGGADAFCQYYSETCGDWTAETACIDWYNAAAPGEADATDGASQACYEYHLGAATMSEDDAAIHCPHARGEAVCVDAAGPSDEATAFCASYTTSCGDWTADTPCAEWYDAAAAGEAGATDGASQACYEYHLGAAAMSEDDAAIHCPHARGEAVCVDAAGPSDAATAFCASYTTTCGDWTADTPCVEWYDAAAAGEADATSGASQACYEYHLGAAAMSEDDAAIHCPHASGEAVCVD
jgi:hypothetical protein